MTATLLGDAQSAKPDGVRLRLAVYDALAAARGCTRVAQQARLHGISKAQMYRIRNGERGVSLELAMRMARDFGTTVEVLFEQVAS